VHARVFSRARAAQMVSTLLRRRVRGERRDAGAPGGAGRRRGVGVGVDGGGVGIVSGAPVSTIIRERVGVELSARGDDARGGVRARVGVLSVRVSHVGGRRVAGGGGGVPLGGRGARFDIGARHRARRVRRCRCARVCRG